MTKPLKIAQISPLFESVPPTGYGGTERVVFFLTEALVRLGHDVTLFASGDSKTSAQLVPCSPRALRLHHHPDDWWPYVHASIERAFRAAEAFDIVHFHTDFIHLGAARGKNHLTTVHGTLARASIAALFSLFSHAPLVSISDAQRRPLPGLNWQGTVHHGLPGDFFAPRFETGDYLAFVGRMSPEKGADRAIAIAKAAGVPIKLAAKVASEHRAYFEKTIAPLLDPPRVEFIGEIGDDAKQPLLAGARALLAPITWDEPFGLVVIEALACGTPVIAYPRGALPELVSDGETGFLVRSIAEGADAVRALPRLSRRRCREVFERRFSAERMAENYLEIYQRLLRVPQRLGARLPMKPAGNLEVN